MRETANCNFTVNRMTLKQKWSDPICFTRKSTFDPYLCEGWMCLEQKCNHMEDKRRSGLLVEVESVLPNVGDRRTLKGEAHAGLRDSYILVIEQGRGLRWTLELTRISGAVAVEGSLEGSIDFECDRCLKPFSFSFEIPVREHVLYGSIADEESGEYETEDGQLDLEPIFRDVICLSLPHRRVCSEDCKGLCLTCGADLNECTCSCSPRAPDSRLAPLAELKRRMAQESQSP